MSRCAFDPNDLKISVLELVTSQARDFVGCGRHLPYINIIASLVAF